MVKLFKISKETKKPTAELLIRIEDKTNPQTPALDAQCTKCGDVIVIKPSGSHWSKRELENPAWTIISTDASLDKLLSMQEGQTGIDIYCPLRRTEKFDLHSLPDTFKVPVFQGRKVFIPYKVLGRFRKVKPLILDPAVLS